MPPSPPWEQPLAISIETHLRPILGRYQAANVTRTCLSLATAAAIEASSESRSPFHLLTGDMATMITCLLLAFFLILLLMSCCGERIRNASPEDGSPAAPNDTYSNPVELLALFANPALPATVSSQLGIRPLAFGQDLRLLMQALPPAAIAIEPAATLQNAEVALLRHAPRFVLFSGHTILGALAFETPTGRLDMHATPSFFVSLLKGLYGKDMEEAARRFAANRRRTAKKKPGERPGLGVSYSRKSFRGLPSPATPATTRAPESDARSGTPGRDLSSSTLSRRLSRLSLSARFSSSRSSDSPLASPSTPEQLLEHLVRMRATAAEMIQRYMRGFVVRRQMGRVLAAEACDTSSVAHIDALVVKLRARLGVVPTSASRARCARRLQCVLLNGCETAEIGRSVLQSLPGVAVVCWESVAEDSAARAFAVGFYAAISHRLENVKRHKELMTGWWPRLLTTLLPERLVCWALGVDARAVKSLRDEDEGELWGEARHESVFRAFEEGCYAFLSAGFRFGDPKEFLHPPTHPHTFRADLSGECYGCMPPVHGSVVLLYTDPHTGKPVERRGQDYAAGVGAEAVNAFTRVAMTARRWSSKLRRRVQLNKRAAELSSGRLSANF